MDKENEIKTEGRRLSELLLPRPVNKFFGHNPIVPLHLELAESARKILREKGIVPTKNGTILRIIK